MARPSGDILTLRSICEQQRQEIATLKRHALERAAEINDLRNQLTIALRGEISDPQRQLSELQDSSRSDRVELQLAKARIAELEQQLTQEKRIELMEALAAAKREIEWLQKEAVKVREAKVRYLEEENAYLTSRLVALQACPGVALELSALSLRDFTLVMQRRFIAYALHDANHDTEKAAKRLRVSTATIYRRMPRRTD